MASSQTGLSAAPSSPFIPMVFNSVYSSPPTPGSKMEGGRSFNQVTPFTPKIIGIKEEQIGLSKKENILEPIEFSTVAYCRQRSATATLCGYAEYGTPSSPARLYKTEIWSGGMVQTKTVGGMCVTPACLDTITISGTAFDGVGDLVHYTGQLSPTGVVVGTQVQYVATGMTVNRVSDNKPYNARFLAGPMNLSNNGQTGFLTYGTTYTYLFQSEYLVLSYYTLNSGCITPGNSIHVYTDSWNRNSVKVLPGCTDSVTNTSTRTIDGIGATFPATAPNATYGATVSTVTTKTSITVTGTNNCATNPDGGYYKAIGSVTMTLSSEDTLTDAINRATVGLAWSAYNTCTYPDCCIANIANRVSNSATFTQVQWEIVGSHFIFGGTYRWTGNVYRKAIGTPGDGTLIQVLSIPVNVNPDGSAIITDQYVPNAEGYSTYVTDLTAEKV